MKKKVYKVGVAVPVFNQETNIGMLIRSLLLQKGSNFKLEEILIASDASTDKTEDIVGCFNDNRIELLSGRTRIGLEQRQAQLFERLKEKVDLVLFFADNSLPADENYIASMVEHIPDDENFSLIVADTKPARAKNYINKIVNTGFCLKKEIALKSGNINRFYVENASKLYSTTYLQSQELPIIVNNNTYTLFQCVDNLPAFLRQSSKPTNWNLPTAGRIIALRLIRNPLEVSFYIFLSLYSKLINKFAKEYLEFRNIYQTSEKSYYARNSA